MPLDRSAPTPWPTAAGLSRPTLWWLLALGTTLLWDFAGADLAFMRLIGSAHGFALRDQWLLERVLHDAVRQAATLFYLALWVWALWPARWSPESWSALRLPRRERVAVVVLVALSLLAVNLIKNQSQTSCPWDLQAFGGRASYVSHWSLGLVDGGSGRCFPGGHASSAFGFLGLCLPWLLPPTGAVRRQVVGQRWLFAILLSGLVAGGVQTLRGAHYPSHTLWTLVICGAVSLAGWRLMNHPRRAARASL